MDISTDEKLLRYLLNKIPKLHVKLYQEVVPPHNFVHVWGPGLYLEAFNQANSKSIYILKGIRNYEHQIVTLGEHAYGNDSRYKETTYRLNFNGGQTLADHSFEDMVVRLKAMQL